MIAKIVITKDYASFQQLMCHCNETKSLIDDEK
jgi:hypothetical protein